MGRWQARALPPLARPGWTLLVQGVDLHVARRGRCWSAFRFLPDARVDDLMISWASPGGGVGPHIDDYDVFLIQVHGKRRWRVGRVADPSWVEGAPLKRLQHFEPSDEWVLEPGDLLYLPPRWGHDGIAEGGDCMTCSAGFSVPSAGVAGAVDLLPRDAGRRRPAGDSSALLPRRHAWPASATPAAMPPALLAVRARGAGSATLAQPLAGSSACWARG
jgi:50S ribosomal protein L16 3-hydroxylase